MRKDDDGIIMAEHICCDITPAFPANKMRMDEIFTPGSSSTQVRHFSTSID